MKWIGQHIFDSIAKFRNTVDFSEDVTFYQPTNDGNPTISLGSSATNRLEIASVYNSGAQTLDEVNFKVYTDSSTTNDGRLKFYVDEVLTMGLLDGAASIYGVMTVTDTITQLNTTTSSATEGGTLTLMCDDGAAMGDDHRLGVIEFQGAEDSSNTRSIGARIQAICRDAWDGSNNDADLEFYTTNGTTETSVLKLDANSNATFARDCTVGGNLYVNGDATTFSSANADDPAVIIENTTVDDQAARLQFKKHRGVDAVDGDNIGEIEFWGYDDGTPSEQSYAKITVEIDDATSGQESGKMMIAVANHDGGINSGLILTGGSVDNEVDATLGHGAASVVSIPGHIDLAGDIDVDGTLETDALTIGGAAFGPNVTKQLTHHQYKADQDTTKTYVSLGDADSEGTATTSVDLPLVAGVGGKLLKIFLRSNKNLQSHDLTWRLETQAGVTFATGPSVVGTQSGDGCQNSTMTTYDFTTDLDSGDNLIDAGDMAYISLQSDTDFGGNVIYYITCLWEWDLS